MCQDTGLTGGKVPAAAIAARSAPEGRLGANTGQTHPEDTKIHLGELLVLNSIFK